jgi:CHAT domain-containing protein
VEDFLISHLPTAGALPVLREREPRIWPGGETRVAAFAPFPEDLPGTFQEIEAVRRVFEDGLFLEGEEASEERFQEEMRSAAVIHAATHGFMNAHNPLFSRIELFPDAGRALSANSQTRAVPGRDGRLEVHELLGSTVESFLVFLSGCETAMGPGWSTGFGRGEEFATLGQAFLHAGAANVIATLWRIDDPGAAAFAEKFYLGLRENRIPGEALAQAQRAMIEDPRHGSPFYWAAYRLTGTGDPWAGPALAPFPGAEPGESVR